MIDWWEMSSKPKVVGLTRTWTDSAGVDWSVHMKFGAIKDRVELIEATVGQPGEVAVNPLSRTVFKRVPLGRIVADTMRENDVDLGMLLAPKGRRVMAATVGPNPLYADLGTGSLARKRRGRPPTSSERLSRVAEVYNANPGRRTEAVAEAFGIQRQSAANLVRSARRQGFLPPTTRGRTGGSPQVD